LRRDNLFKAPSGKRRPKKTIFDFSQSTVGVMSLPERDRIVMAQETTDIEDLCKSDRELTEALKRMLFLNPGMISTSREALTELAQGREQKDNRLLARVNYETAGDLR